MNAIVIIAHGSRAAAANEEVRRLAAWLASQSIADLVAPAFLEQTTPSLATAVDDLVAAGATTILVFPLFLNSGRHVARDVPTAVFDAAERYPAVDFRLLTHLGGADGFNQAVAAAILGGISSAVRLVADEVPG